MASLNVSIPVSSINTSDKGTVVNGSTPFSTENVAAVNAAASEARTSFVGCTIVVPRANYFILPLTEEMKAELTLEHVLMFNQAPAILGYAVGKEYFKEVTFTPPEKKKPVTREVPHRTMEPIISWEGIVPTGWEFKKVLDFSSFKAPTR